MKQAGKMAAEAVATIGVNGLLAVLPFVKGTKGAAATEEEGAASSVARSGLSASKIEEIRAIPKGSRPDPSTYMSQEEINGQLSEFSGGASRVMRRSSFDKYGPAQTDGTAFVMPKSRMDEVLATSGEDRGALEKQLGFPSGSLKDQALVRIDINNPSEYGLRIPSGNEAGANDLWIPGGALPDSSPEGVIDLGGVTSTAYTVTPIH